MGNYNDLLDLSNQKYFNSGEVNFIRSEKDLHEVLANIMQSTNALIRLMNKYKITHIDCYKKGSWIIDLEWMVSDLLLCISKVCTGILVKERSVCIPAFCVCLEAVSVIVTKLVVSLILLRENGDKKYLTNIFGEVFVYI